MLEEKEFSPHDLVKTKKSLKVIVSMGLLVMLFCTVISFVFGLMGLLKKGNGYWYTTILLLILQIPIVAIKIIWDYYKTNKDISNKTKMVGYITVITKSDKKRNFEIKTNVSEIKKINLLTQNNFDKVQEGDNLYIEFTKYNKTILKLTKDGDAIFEHLAN